MFEKKSGNSDLEDELLLRQIKQGNKSSFNILYEKYWETLYVNAYVRLKDSEHAKDIIQEIFTHVWIKREALEIENLPAYLNTAVRNKVFKLIAKQKLSHPFFDVLETVTEVPPQPDARGTITFMTGSLMHDYVLEAINNSSKEYCMLDELQDKAGERIAKMAHAEAATVTSGAFSALTLGMAGILTGMDLKKVEQLPHLEEGGMKTEVIIQKNHKIHYNHALVNCGVKLVYVETAEDVDKAVNEKTASMHFLGSAVFQGKIQHEEWLALARKHHLPATIDMAANVPPVENLWKFNDMGYSFVAMSGGKAIRGPQSTGILMGKKEIIAAARLSAPPRGATIGRGMKVNKEEILGLYVALERYINQDHDKEWKEWEDRVAVIEKAAKSVKGVSTKVTVPPVADHTPTLIISWDAEQVKISGDGLLQALIKGSPSIEAYGGGKSSITVSPWMMVSGQEKIVAARIKEELLKASV